MSAKHTPGPWAAPYPSNGYSMRHPPIVSDHGHVATTSWQGDLDHTDANARLIAAAPEMLRALRIGQYHAVKAAERARGLANWNERNGMQGIAAEYLKSAEESDEAANAIRAAITQATGE